MSDSNGHRSLDCGDAPTTPRTDTLGQQSNSTGRGRLSRATKWLQLEARESPVAFTAGLISIVVALTAATVGLERVLRPDGVEVQLVDIDFRTGQTTSVSKVFPVPRKSGRLGQSRFDGEPQGVFADAVNVDFVVRSDSQRPSYVVDVRVEVDERRPPLRGTWVPPEGAGPGGSRILFADLDENPVEMYTDGGFQFPLKVSSFTSQAFTIDVTTDSFYVKYHIELDYLDVAGELHTEKVYDHDNAAFELTSSRKARKVLPQ